MSLWTPHGLHTFRADPALVRVESAQTVPKRGICKQFRVESESVRTESASVCAVSKLLVTFLVTDYKFLVTKLVTDYKLLVTFLVTDYKFLVTKLVTDYKF